MHTAMLAVVGKEQKSNCVLQAAVLFTILGLGKIRVEDVVIIP